MISVSGFENPKVISKGLDCSCKQEFNFGVEFVLLISFLDNACDQAEDALVSFEGLLMGFPSLIVQSTRGMF